MENDGFDGRELLGKLQKPIPHHPDWSDADYAAEILKRVEQLLSYYAVDIESLQSHDAAMDSLCRILFDWVPGLRAEHMTRLTESAPTGMIFGETADPLRSGVAQPVSDRLNQALRHYRTMDERKSRRAELQRFVERSVAVDTAARKSRGGQSDAS